MKRSKNILVRLDEETYEELKMRAKGKGLSMAGVVREATTAYLRGGSISSSDILFTLNGRIDSGRKDGARKHDQYLYPRARK